ncbi:MAG: hypothetical protein ISP90_16050 [Nevskia sp.]|nr:hypothetical protein [Nevskia sp.]
MRPARRTAGGSRRRAAGAARQSAVPARSAIWQVFEELGGIEAMAAWAREDLTRFYQSVFPRLLAAEARAQGGAREPAVPRGWLKELLGRLDDGGHKELVKTENPAE